MTPTGEVTSSLNEVAFLVGLGLIFLIEANTIFGKMFPIIASVRNVIISSFALTVLLSGINYYL